MAAEPVPWPGNEIPIHLMALLGTQWRMGFAGPCGLDYSVLPVLCAALGVSWPDLDLLQAIRVMEAAALERMRESRDA